MNDLFDVLLVMVLYLIAVILMILDDTNQE